MTQDALKLARLRDDDSDDELSPLCKSIVDGTHADVKPRRSRDADMISELAARITRLEAANKRAAKKSTVSKRDFDFAIETIGGFVGKEIRPILERIENWQRNLLACAGQASGIKTCVAMKASLSLTKDHFGFALRHRTIALATMHPHFD